MTDRITVNTRTLRACTNCVQAKAKCRPSAEAEGECDRCFRLSKDCRPSPARRPRTVGRHSTAKVKMIEEKLDTLVAMLKSTTAEKDGTGSMDGPSAAAPRDQGLTSSGSDGNGELTTPDSSSTTPITSSSSVLDAQATYPDLSVPSPQAAESYLGTFRLHHLPQLPFMALPPSTTAEQLRVTSPFLWLSIMTVASNRRAQQMALSNYMREVFGREAFITATRSLDLLLSVLVYITWDRHHCNHRQIHTSLLQFATAILHDLFLDKPSIKDQGAALAYDLKDARKPARFTRSATLEERRVLLGCWLISTGTSITQRGEPLRWTPYCEECLQTLDETKEIPSDLLFVQLIKLRLITERITTGSALDDGAACFYLKPPAIASLRSVQAHLRHFQGNIPAELESNETLLLELYNASAIIHNVIFSSSTPDPFASHPNLRFSCLWTCSEAVRAWIEQFLLIPPTHYDGFSILTYGNMTRWFCTLYQLLTCEAPEWDRGASLREMLDVDAVLSRVERNFAAAIQGLFVDRAALAGEVEGEDILELIASRLGRLRGLMQGIMVEQSPVQLDLGLLDGLGDFSMDMLDSWGW